MNKQVVLNSNAPLITISLLLSGGLSLRISFSCFSSGICKFGVFPVLDLDVEGDGKDVLPLNGLLKK